MAPVAENWGSHSSILPVAEQDTTGCPRYLGLDSGGCGCHVAFSRGRWYTKYGSLGFPENILWNIHRFCWDNLKTENQKMESMRCFYHLRLVGVSGFNFPIIQWNMKIWILNRMDGISDDFKIFNEYPMVYPWFLPSKSFLNGAANWNLGFSTAKNGLAVLVNENHVNSSYDSWFKRLLQWSA